MNLKSLATKHSAFDGKVTFFMLGWHNPQVEITSDELARIEPSTLWRNRDTGDEVYDDPHAGMTDDAIGEAQRAESPWERVELWGGAHHVFSLCDPLTVEIEFGKKLSPPLKAFQTYWENRNGNTANNWELYRQLVATDIINAWYTAYVDTRDTSMFGAEELQAEPDEGDDSNA